MVTIKIPNSSNSLTELDLALKYKNGKYKYELEQSEKEILGFIYKTYDSVLGEPQDEFKSNMLKSESNHALYQAYTEIQIGGRLNELRSNLLLSVEKCPYCGISPADELDHYLPHSIYKAISIYSRNLIPICHTCNNLKRTSVNTICTSSFYHAYFESFPENPFLIAEINFIDNHLIVEFKIDNSFIKSPLIEKLNFQLTRTNLNYRLQKEVNTFLFDQRTSLDKIFTYEKANGIIDLFTQEYQKNKKIYGINFWKTTFLLSLSKCFLFCNGGFYDYYKSKGL